MRRTRASFLLLGVLAAASVLTGCVESDDGTGFDAEAFETALEAPGTVHEPDEQAGATDWRVKLLEPREPERAAQGERPFVILVYDATTQEPVTDATVLLESWMLEHDHGTGGERDPRHDAGGVYRGTTNHFMEGEWEVRLRAQRPGGDSFALAIPFMVQ